MITRSSSVYRVSKKGFSLIGRAINKNWVWGSGMKGGHDGIAGQRRFHPEASLF